MILNSGAMESTEQLQENYIILKGRFKAVDTNTYGIFIIFINEEIKEVENMIAIASHYSSLYDIDPHLPWYSFEENLVNIKWKGDIAVNISLDLQHYMESSLEHDRGNELYFLIKNNDELKIESLLQAILIKPLSDRNIIIETVSEFVTKKAIQMIREERNKPKNEKVITAEKQFDTDKGILLNVDLILAPVSGIPIFELKKGDKIMVRINDRTSRGKYYIDKLGARVNGNIIPVPAEVTNISKNENKEYSIICKLEEGIFGKAIEAEQVKLKRYDELLGLRPESETITLLETPELKKGLPIFFIITGGLMFIVLLFFILLWFYNII